MPPPTPIQFIAGSLPTGLKGTLQDIFNAFVDNLQGYIDPSASTSGNFLPGQIGGSQPTTDVGPWLKNGTEWWFWNPGTASYAPQSDALPIGGIIYWGGTSPPARFLSCDGRAVSRSQYGNLFNVLGTTWGACDGVTTFNLPPSDILWRPCSPAVEPINKRGGSQTIKLDKGNLPALTAAPLWTRLGPPGNTDGYACHFNNNQGQSSIAITGVGANTPIDVTNPFVTVLAVVRYQ